MAGETSLSRGIREALTAKGCLVLPQQAGMMRVTNKGNTRVIRMGAPGVPDLLVIWTAGSHAEFGFLEVKTPKGELSAAQERWHEMADRRGIRVSVVRSISEALDTLEIWKRPVRVVDDAVRLPA